MLKLLPPRVSWEKSNGWKQRSGLALATEHRQRSALLASGESFGKPGDPELCVERSRAVGLLGCVEWWLMWSDAAMRVG